MLKIEKIDEILHIKFNNTNRFNALIAEPVKEKLKSFFEGDGVKLILDLEGVKFIDSTGFGVFLSILKTANSTSGTFRICNVTDEVMELFKLLQLQNVFDIYPNLDSCVATFKE
ncbi:STAS domain-containing protein [Bacteroidales bacterium]|nr:STAS domain-containing protein [Bacteroidales bacterium]